VLSFEPLPVEYFVAESPPRLTSIREKISALKTHSLHQLLLLRFNQALADTRADEFIKQVLIDGLDTKYLLIGDDFQFGKDREGNFATLKAASEKYGFELHQAQTLEKAGARISSTRIRKELASGNITPAAEFNIFVDPHAAKAVFDSGVDLVAFGLDITHQMRITPARLADISGKGGRCGSVVADLLEFFNQYDMSKYGWDGAPLHDPCTIAWLIDPEIFSGRKMSVSVDINDGINLGRTVADWYTTTDAEPNVTVITDGDSDRFFDLIVERLATL